MPCLAEELNPGKLIIQTLNVDAKNTANLLDSLD